MENLNLRNIEDSFKEQLWDALMEDSKAYNEQAKKDLAAGKTVKAFTYDLIDDPGDTVNDTISDFTDGYVVYNDDCYDLMKLLENKGYNIADVDERYGRDYKYTPLIANDVLSIYLDSLIQKKEITFDSLKKEYFDKVQAKLAGQNKKED